MNSSPGQTDFLLQKHKISLLFVLLRSNGEIFNLTKKNIQKQQVYLLNLSVIYADTMHGVTWRNSAQSCGLYYQSFTILNLQS
jgi:hypothetical protein